jgi:alpha-tubulin suppressor-like RCC1 family protein
MKLTDRHVSVWAAALLISCNSGADWTLTEACEGVTCSDMGTCAVLAGNPYCICRAGYHPEFLACVENDADQPCRDVTCSDRGVCLTTEEDVPYCDCDEGYEWPAGTRLLCLRPVETDASTDWDVEIPPLCGNGYVDTGEECDDGRNGDQEDGCTDVCTYSCMRDEDCDDGHGCTDDACEGASHACSHDILPSGTPCRPAVEECDSPESCNGTSPDCPPDVGNCWQYITAGIDHTCGIYSDGAILCWGRGEEGQLGDGNEVDSYRPVPVQEDGPWSSACGGYDHSCAIKRSGELYCWGSNFIGQLGDGTTENRLVPERVGTNEDWAVVSCGWGYSCGIRTGGEAYCWGSNLNGKLGTGTTDTAIEPTAVDLAEGWSAVDADGGNHSCGVTAAGGAYCWGYNDDGQLGTGTTAEHHSPAPVSGGEDVQSIEVSTCSTCMLDQAGEVRCLGCNFWGQLGDGTDTDRLLPAPIESTLSWSFLVSGTGHVCAVTVGSALYCWGSNFVGELGDGNVSTTSSAPVRVSGLGSVVMAAAGSEHTCAVGLDRFLYCWGSNEHGKLGDGTVENRSLPTLISRR